MAVNGHLVVSVLAEGGVFSLLAKNARIKYGGEGQK